MGERSDAAKERFRRAIEEDIRLSTVLSAQRRSDARDEYMRALGSEQVEEDVDQLQAQLRESELEIPPPPRLPSGIDYRPSWRFHLGLLLSTIGLAMLLTALVAMVLDRLR